MPRARRLLPTLLLLPLLACGGSEAPAPPPAEVTPPVAVMPPGVPEPTPDPLDAVRANYNGAMMNPAQATATAPATYTVKFETTKGDILIDVTRDWAPNGADRFFNLVTIGYFDDIAIFRVIDGFMAQMGIHGDPQVNTVWRNARIVDDPVQGTNSPGMVSFATAGPNTRTTQVFMNLGNNGNLDGMGFAPFGKLRDMAVLNTIYKGYGEGAPQGRGPHQGLLQSKGNAYLRASFPELDYVKKATIVTQ